MLEIFFAILLLLHILAVMVAVGTVTVTDYLHLLGIRDRRLEKRSLFVFPILSNLILGSLALIYITGIILVLIRPTILNSGLFQLKVALVFVVTVNGYVLHHFLFPKIRKAVQTNSHSEKLIKQAAFGGSLSVISWYAIVVLALTNDFEYAVWQFLILYSAALVVAYNVAVYVETQRSKK
mgnify:CR=1 FL=1